MKPLQNHWLPDAVVCVLSSSYLEAEAGVFLEPRSKTLVPSFCIESVHTFMRIGICPYESWVNLMCVLGATHLVF